MPYRSIKRYGHDLGFSCAFRQWRAESQCRFVHGYSLAFELVFEADKLDDKNWVVDFGSMKPVKDFLTNTFDHKTVIAYDDPELPTFKSLNDIGLIQLRMMPHVGCESFAAAVGDFVSIWLNMYYGKRCRLVSVEVKEHGANSALYHP